MNRLWVQLALAFALVILVTVGIVALLANVTAGQAFRDYLSYLDKARYSTLLEVLTDQYQASGGWQGVEKVLEQAMTMMKAVPKPMLGEQSESSIAENRLPQVILADAEGRVIYDKQGGQLGRELSDDERAVAQSIVVEGQVVGSLLIVRPEHAVILGPLEQRLLSRVRLLLLGGALLAGALGVLFGLTLSRSLTAPLQRLATAARAVAAGDFSRRVQVSGSAELMEVSQAFNEMAAGLEKAEKQRQNMIADIAHELRTPLSVLQGNLQAILDDVYPLDKAEISQLYDETRLLSRLVDDLRELALADAGQLRLNLQPVHVAHVLQTTVEGLSLAAEAHNVTLSVHVDEGLPVVQADPDRLAQVLRNLLVNALHHTPSGGSVAVTATFRENVVEIAVTDTGIGIAPEDLPHVFDRFWRADRSRAHDGRWRSGTGLGLSIAQSLIRAHGGRIWAESVPGEGTTFRFTLPVG